MAYVRTKMIKGKPYQYMQKSFRKNGKVFTKHIRYIGKGVASVGESISGKADKGLGTTQNVIYGSLHDKRSNKNIAKDMKRTSKHTYNNPEDWEKAGKNKSDLRGWDTKHISEHRKGYVDIYDPMKAKMESVFKNADVSSRVKTLPSMVKKLKKKNVNEPFTEKNFEDIVGMRVTFKSIQDLKKGVSEMRKKFDIKEEEDYITKPKGGYRSYHFTALKKGKPVEVQFRTKRQTRWADWMHDRLYDNVQKTRERVGDVDFKRAQEYAHEMSGYFARLDEGLDAVKPKVPDVVKNKLGGEM